MQLGFFEKEKSTDWKWTMEKDYPKKNGLKVFSCFACGGGSTMGYKLAGFDVVGCNEIDPKMNEVYIKNHNPKYNFLEDIRDFNKREDLPEELYNLDILDGSPPCSTFATCGEREKGWGKEKKFREGQKMQTLDDLLFIFINTVDKLKPKVAILENVEGLLLGNAWAYVQEIYKRFNEIGYKVKHYLLEGEKMGVPQTRHRVFFIATRLDFDLEKLNMSFDYEPIYYKDIKYGKGILIKEDSKGAILIKEARDNETYLSPAHIRLFGNKSWVQARIIDDNKVMPTLRASIADIFRRGTLERITWEDCRNSQTFPQDYDFMPNSANKVGYICGMSVPPIMIKRIANRLLESGIFNPQP